MKALDRHIKNRREFRKVNDKAIYCHPCEKTVKIRSAAILHCINSHSESRRHKDKFGLWQASASEQISIEDSFRTGDSKFIKELAKFVVGCNIPYTRVETRPFAEFFKFLGYSNLPDESTLRKNLSSIYQNSLDGIRNYIGDNLIYLQVDESRIAERAIVSVLVGKLDGKPSISHCLNIIEVEDGKSINNTTVTQIVNDSLHLLWPDEIYYDRFRLFSSDQARYMTKSGKTLKRMYPELLHITCICHALHRVCEKIREDHRHAKKFVGKFSKVLARAPRRRNLLDRFVGAPMHSLPVITRWGTWLSFCAYSHNHFEKIKEFIKDIEDEDNSTIELLNSLAHSNQLQQELIEISQFQQIIVAIKQLEEGGISIYRQRELLNEAKNSFPPIYQAKLEECMSKNPDFEQVFSISNHEIASKFMFAPLVSVDVEGSFERLKNILTSPKTPIHRNQLQDVLCITIVCSRSRIMTSTGFRAATRLTKFVKISTILTTEFAEINNNFNHQFQSQDITIFPWFTWNRPRRLEPRIRYSAERKTSKSSKKLHEMV